MLPVLSSLIQIINAKLSCDFYKSTALKRQLAHNTEPTSVLMYVV